MRLCRFEIAGFAPRVGIVADDGVVDLASVGIDRLTALLEMEDAVPFLDSILRQKLPRHPIASVRFLTPVERQEVWAAGVTYLRSRTARMEESEFSATAYDRVYEAARPELFFKSMPEKVVSPGGAVGIRRDATWSVPEPELVLVVSSKGRLAGFSIGNDVSSRDIEGENLLYLPQAKVYSGSCAIGPWIMLGPDEAKARDWKIHLEIRRDDKSVFKGDTAVSQIKRSFRELIDFLTRSQSFPNGAMLLTGTGIVPPDAFTLQAGDQVRITIDGIGTLANQVNVV